MTARSTFAIALLALAVAGCSTAPANPESQRRLRNLNNTISSAVANEERRPKLLERDFAEIDAAWQEDVRNTKANAVAVDRAFQNEFRNWNRKQPAYERDIAKWLGGRPEQIVPTFNKIVN